MLSEALGGAPAPYVVTKLAERYNADVPYPIGAAACLVAIGILVVRRHHLRTLHEVDADHAVADTAAVR
jgi:hypothetical protein